jgi:GntR family transcriptional regulator, rspAB operon transcriptional repressor
MAADPTPKLSPPPLASIASQIEAHLERSIFKGELQSGQRLSEPEIAEWFQTSRSPVREALRRLESSGLVTIEPRRGASVKVPSRGEIEDTLAIREALEGMAARLAAERGDAEDIVALRDCARRRPKEARRGEPRPDFHEALLRAARNERLQELIRGSMNLFRIVRTISARAEGRAPHSADEHLAILRAIEARDPNAAEEAARRHVRKVRANILNAFDAHARAAQPSEPNRLAVVGRRGQIAGPR